MIKKIFALVLMMFVCVSAAGCSKEATRPTEISPEDKALHDQLMGAWVLLGDENIEYDEEGNMVAFSVFEFTDKKTKIHQVGATETRSWVINEYFIQDGKFNVIQDGKIRYQEFAFTEDGKLEMYSDNSVDTLRRLKDEDLGGRPIPLDQPVGIEAEESRKLEEQMQENSGE